MSCTYSNNEIDSMFDNEPNDIHNDTLLSDKLFWNNDNFSMTSHDIDWIDIYDDIPGHTFDQIHDKNKDKLLDFDNYLPELNDILEPSNKTVIKSEPTHTNSVTSSYLTDECSPDSSINNSPVSRKVKKRDFQVIDSSSEKSFALYDETIEHPSKTTKIEIFKRENVLQNQKTIYKILRDPKVVEAREPIIINNNNPRQILKLRHNSTTPYIVTSSVKSVNISKYSQEKQHFDVNSIRNSTFLPQTQTQNSYSPSLEQDCDLLTGEYYDNEVDLYSEYKPRVGSYLNQNVFNNSNNTNSGALFQTPIPQSGPLYLTDEEKRTLLQENYAIPTRVPLTKQEERNLKKVRRKIKNKLSAQESRRKKKEYVDALEKKVEAYEQERLESKRRIETLENQQRTLQNQIRHYQHQIMNKGSGGSNTTSTGLMLFMICFALILVGGSVPSSYKRMNSPQSSFVSSSSLYYMGYGPSSNVFNNSDDVAMYQRHSRNKPDGNVDRTLDMDIVPRQSILLGEDNDERNFEELVLSYSKSHNKICGSNYRTGPVVPPNNAVKNHSYHETIQSDNILIARLANINFVK